MSCNFSVAIVRSEDARNIDVIEKARARLCEGNLPRPLWPWVITPSSRGRFRQQLKVGDGLGSVSHRSTDTIVTGITTTNDDDVFPFGVDVIAVFELGIQKRLRVQLLVGYQSGLKVTPKKQKQTCKYSMAK
jgi:hypothetical protein